MKRSFGVDWYHLIPPHVKGILNALHQRGRKAYLVGGAVRDLWLGKTPKDFDLVSEASPEEIEAWFEKTVAIGKAFGIMTVVTPEGSVEVARFRADGAYTDGRRPDSIAFTNPEEDARRRDFTINALFYDLAAKEILDYVGGLSDLEAKVIHSVGDPSLRFEEDSLRMLRVARFHSQLPEFTVHEDLLRAIPSLAHRLRLVSKERITQEMEKIFLSPKPSLGLGDLVSTGMWQEIFLSSPPPDLQSFDSWNQSLSLALAALSFQCQGFQAEKSFLLGKETKALISQTLGALKQLPDFFSLGLAQQKQLAASPGFEEALKIAHPQFAKAQEWKKQMGDRVNPPQLLGGKDLLQLGFAPGPGISKALQELRTLQLEEKILNREDALAWLKARA